MNSWYVEIIELFIFSVLFICFIILLVMLIKAKKYNKTVGIKRGLLAINILLFVGMLVFSLSHSTYYKYNDWIIMNSNINFVENKYGAFDWGEYQEGKSGKVGYYIYTDNGPVMPDHLKHYYWIYFDESGIIYKVEEGIQPGG